MPLYEYQCDACAHRFEQIQRFSDPLLTSCPRCEGAVRKLVSSPAIQFKGSGWYVTDYAQKGRKDPADAAEAKAGAEAEGAASKSEKQDGAKQDGAKKQDGGKAGDAAGSSDAAGASSKAAKPAAASS